MAISQEIHQSSVTKINMRITHLKMTEMSLKSPRGQWVNAITHIQTSCCWVQRISLVINIHVSGPCDWVIISSGNGLSPAWCHAIIWTNADSLSTGALATNTDEISIKIQIFFSKNKIKTTLTTQGQQNCQRGKQILESFFYHKFYAMSLWAMKNA